MSDLLDKLNNEQKEGVMHDQGPLLIVAGAGTGKTTVLINRLLYLITKREVDSDNILLLTFTEKSSQELVERADKALPYGYVNLWIHTFHGLCDQILRQYGLDIGINPDYEILSSAEQWILIKKNLNKFNLDYYKPLGNPDKFISELIRHFSRLKDENITVQEYLEYATGLLDKKEVPLSSADQKNLDVDRINELANAYQVYNKLLLDDKLLDFGDLITYTIKLFKERPDILKYYQQKFKYIMVDEFQDTNWSQYELIKMLSLPENNLVAVGDDDQSIFKFRGASLSNIMQFQSDYPTAKQIVLIKNYRSGQVILDSAYNFIQNNNPNRLEEKLNIDKAIQSQIDQPGEVKYLSWPTVLTETQSIVAMIKQLNDNGQAQWSDMAILIRANGTADRFIAELKRQSIPYQFVSLRGLYYKKIVLDILAYFKMLDNYHESSALLRVLDMEIFSVNHLDVINLNRYARAHLISLYEALEKVDLVPNVSPEGQTGIKKLLNFIKQHTEISKKDKVSRLYVKIVRDLFLPFLNEQKQEEYDYLNQFYRKVLRFEQSNPEGLLPDFRQLLDWEMEAGETGSLQLNFEDADTVKIITIHSAKGLEFKYVWLVDLVDKRFPTINRSERIPISTGLVKEQLTDGDLHLEEERRLFYVAMTRAKYGLYISGARDHGGAALKKPSRFIEEAGVSTTIIEESVVGNELERDLDAPDVQAVSEFKYQLPERFSFSQLEVFNLCPWRYRYEHILKVPSAPKAATTFGRAVHNSLRAFLQPLLPDQPQLKNQQNNNEADMSWSCLEKLYKEYWQDNGYDNAEQAEDYKQKGQTMLKEFQQQIASEPLPKVEFLEKDFSWKVGDVNLVGAIDRVDRLPDGSLSIIDYKTGKPKDKLALSDKRQLLIYQLALEQILQEPVSQLAYYYLENNTLQSFTAKPAELDKARDYILDIVSRIKELDFRATPGHPCSFCDWRNLCEFRK